MTRKEQLRCVYGIYVGLHIVHNQNCCPNFNHRINMLVENFLKSMNNTHYGREDIVASDEQIK